MERTGPGTRYEREICRGSGSLDVCNAHAVTGPNFHGLSLSRLPSDARLRSPSTSSTWFLRVLFYVIKQLHNEGQGEDRRAVLADFVESRPHSSANISCNFLFFFYFSSEPVKADKR